ncbi:MAG: hypothetical protein WC246_00335 [Candidatus Paceibacterota bacterium]|jgi:hypothetical protein
MPIPILISMTLLLFTIGYASGFLHGALKFIGRPAGKGKLRPGSTWRTLAQAQVLETIGLALIENMDTGDCLCIYTGRTAEQKLPATFAVTKSHDLIALLVDA